MTRRLSAGVVALLAIVLLAACGAEVDRTGEPPADVDLGRDTTSAPDGPIEATASVDPVGYLVFNQQLVQGFAAGGLDLDDVDAVFWHVFSGLDDEVTVFPSENYYYFILYIAGQQIWGNIRLPAGQRDEGILSFGYFEFIEFSTRPSQGLTRSKFFTEANGLAIERIDDFTYAVSYRGRTVTFNLHRLRQDPPELFKLGEDEVFIERTLDESGFHFFLLFNERTNYFIWVLNEEEPKPDIFEPLTEDLVVGRRSGFAFWIDAAHGDRKVLLGVRRLNVNRNDYYDGPFDQLADNYAQSAGISDYMQRAYPALRGEIDEFGYYFDQPLRVALSTYYTYFAPADLLQFLALVNQAEDPLQFISNRGVQPSTSPNQTSPEEAAPDRGDLDE